MGGSSTLFQDRKIAFGQSQFAGLGQPPHDLAGLVLGKVGLKIDLFSTFLNTVFWPLSCTTAT